MQSWLNWYSIGLENRHSERISGFESLALRYARMAKMADAPDLGSDAGRHEGSTPSPSTVQCIFIKKGRKHYVRD